MLKRFVAYFLTILALVIGLIVVPQVSYKILDLTHESVIPVVHIIFLAGVALFPVAVVIDCMSPREPVSGGKKLLQWLLRFVAFLCWAFICFLLVAFTE
jgi:hypothetical protein